MRGWRDFVRHHTVIQAKRAPLRETRTVTLGGGPKQYDTALDQIIERLGVSGDRYDAAGMHAVGRRGKEDGSGVIALRASTPASASEVGASSHFSQLSLGFLRREFSNPTPMLKSLISRWKRGVYRVSQRVENTPIQDVRGACVRRIGKPQTFLTPSEVDRLVDDYLAGFSVGYLAQKYGVHRATVSAHLTRRGITRRLPGLRHMDAEGAAQLPRGDDSLIARRAHLSDGSLHAPDFMGPCQENELSLATRTYPR